MGMGKGKGEGELCTSRASRILGFECASQGVRARSMSSRYMEVSRAVGWPLPADKICGQI